MTDPGLADATYIEPITPDIVERIIAARAARRAAADHGRADRAQHGDGAGAIGRARAPRRRADRRRRRRRSPRPRTASSSARRWTASASSRRRAGSCDSLDEAREALDDGRPAGDHPPVLHARRHRRRHRLQPARNSRRSSRGGLRASPTHEVLIEESVLGWKEFEMEVVRDRARQLHHRLLDRERRSDGRPYRRFSVTVAPALTLTDKEYQMHAQRLDRGAARDRRRYRRLERAVRGQSRATAASSSSR